MNDPFVGLWQPLSAELGGEEAPRMALEKMELEFADGKYTVRFGGIAADHGTYAIDQEGLTLVGITGPNAGRTIPSFARIIDGMLSVCYGLGGVRPDKLATGGNPQLYLVNYRRKE